MAPEMLENMLLSQKKLQSCLPFSLGFPQLLGVMGCEQHLLG